MAFTRRAVLGILPVVLLVTGCNDQEAAQVPDTAVSIVTTAPNENPGPSSTAPPSVSQVSTPASTNGTQHLTAVRAAGQSGGDRVTFEFDGATPPGYVIGYSNGPITQDGSGNPVSVAGSAALSVRFVTASGVDLTNGVNQTYNGPNRFSPTGTTTVVELAQVSDFEAHLVWAIGTQGQVPFTVSTLSGPNRVVIDFHP